MGLRERKKERTRELLAGTAWELFVDRGFDQVSVAEIAREAGVAPATVFNYFPTKEDLFYSGLESFGDQLVAAVRDRERGESVLAAFRRFLESTQGMLVQVEAGDAAALGQLRAISRVIVDSPTLLDRERQAVARNTEQLAELLAYETGAPPEDVAAHVNARVVANALIGVQTALIGYARQRVLSEPAPTQLATEVRELGHRAFELLANGLDDYAVRRG